MVKVCCAKNAYDFIGIWHFERSTHYIAMQAINDLMTRVYEVFIFKGVCYYSKDES